MQHIVDTLFQVHRNTETLVKECNKIYHLPYEVSASASIIALTTDPELDYVTFVRPYKFNDKWLFTRGPDIHLEYNIVTFPGEVIKSVALYLELPSGTVLLDKLYYPTNWFSFGILPNNPYVQLYLDVEFEKELLNTQRTILVKCLNLQSEHRVKFSRLMAALR